jgi:hypothetical protein
VSAYYISPLALSKSKNLDPIGRATEDERCDKDTMDEQAAAKLFGRLTGLLLAVRQSPALVTLHPQQLETQRRAGKFDDSAMLERIAAGKPDAIVASLPLAVENQNRQFPLRWLEAARGRYVLEKNCTVPARTLFVYRSTNR